MDLLLNGSLEYRNNPQKFVRKLELKPLKISEKALVQVLSDNAHQNYFLSPKKLQWNKTEIQQKQMNHPFDHISSRDKVNHPFKEVIVLLFRVTSV